MRSELPAKITAWSPTTVPPRSAANPIPLRPRAGLAVAPAYRPLLEIEVAALRGGLSEQQRGARRRIDLLL